MREFAGFNNAGHIPLAVQNPELAARMHVTLLRIIFVDQNVVRRLEDMAFEKNQRPAQALEPLGIDARNRIEAAADELIDNTTGGDDMRFHRQLLDKLVRHGRAAEPCQERASRRTKENIRAYALG